MPNLPNTNAIFAFADQHGIPLIGDPRSLSHEAMVDFADLTGRDYLIDHAVAYMDRCGEEMSEDAWRLMLASEMVDEWRAHIADMCRH